MSELREYKCPNCNSPISFDIGVQKMKCGYCDSEIDVDSLMQYQKDIQAEATTEIYFDTEEESKWNEEDKERLVQYSCSSCGGSIMATSNTAASFCPFCDSPVIVSSKLSGDLKPDYVIPFKIDKEEAKKIFNKFLSSKRLLPREFKDKNHIEEMKALYVPYWLFSATSNADARYKASKTRNFSDSRYSYSENNIYSVNRSGNLRFENIAIDASKKLDDRYMRELEPFDTKDMLDFNTAYLSGFFADAYDVPLAETLDLAKAKIEDITKDFLTNSVEGYNEVIPEYLNINLKDTSNKYALYPVWILNTKYAGKNYLFLMNGQTGKFTGDMPADKGAAFRQFLGIFFATSMFIFFVLSLLAFIGGLV